MGKKTDHEIKDFILDDDVSFTLETLPAPVRRALATLNALPFLKMLSTRKLAGESKMTQERLNAFTNHPALQPFRHKFQGRLYWGSQETIAAFVKKLGEGRV